MSQDASLQIRSARPRPGADRPSPAHTVREKNPRSQTVHHPVREQPSTLFALADILWPEDGRIQERGERACHPRLFDAWQRIAPRLRKRQELAVQATAWP